MILFEICKYIALHFFQFSISKLFFFKLHFKALMFEKVLDWFCTVVATTNKNSNASLVYSFLYKIVEVSYIDAFYYN